ncbi:MAG: ATP-binding cassette domain-containing protein [Bacteroidales bacterium]
MNESLLQSLMRLFAIMVSINRDVVHILARNFVESFLTEEFNPTLAKRYLKVFDQYSKELEGYEKGKKNKKIAAWSVKILTICQQVVEELHIRHRFTILISLIRFSKYVSEVSATTSLYGNLRDAIRTVADGLLIRKEEYEACSTFITDKFYKVEDRNNLLIVSNDKEFLDGEIKHVQKDNFPGQLIVLRIERADTYLFQYLGKAKLHIQGKYIFPRHVYLLPKASSIKGETFAPCITPTSFPASSGWARSAIHFAARDIEFRYKNSPNGIKRFSFQGRSGELVGVLGGSGAGKSTLLRVLTGSMELDHGDIFINGFHLRDDAEELEGIIGFVPQDDLLMEELTVYQNLWFNARLCLDGNSPEEIRHTVEHVLNELDLFEARHLKVGTPLNNTISGGQRKRLNIALELVREPQILFVDEPTSGLSSTDSENVVALLKEQAMKGKLVIANIHQPSSDLFRQFDKILVLDRGGFPVYAGNPLEGITYVKTLARRVDANEAECRTCGNTNPEEILKVIEERDVDQFGEFTSRRKIKPAHWYQEYKQRIEAGVELKTVRTWVPFNKFMIPTPFRQFLIFFKRNLLAKLADRQFMSIALLVAPLLALILGYFSKYVAGTETDPRAYVFSQNENLPAYLFMSVVVALFLGLIVAAEEIIKDRKILERESFLNLNRSAYLLSKIGLLFLLSAFQMLLFVFIGNRILEIRGMDFSYWLVLFSTACFANLLGLNISDGLKSVVAIYVIVPFLLVPQIMLAGVIVKFDKLYYRFASHETVPLSGNVMASRWAYEALAVNQFMNNAYQIDLSEMERMESNVNFDRQFLIPALVQEIGDAEALLPQRTQPEFAAHLETARRGMEGIFLVKEKPDPGSLSPDRFDATVARDLTQWLEAYRSQLTLHRNRLLLEKDKRIDSLIRASGGAEAYRQLKQDRYNESLADLVLNRNELHKIVNLDGTLVRKMEPIHQNPDSPWGRSHFFASYKHLGSWRVPCLYFNLLVIWAMTLGLYVTLRFRVLAKVLAALGSLQNRRRPFVS